MNQIFIVNPIENDADFTTYNVETNRGATVATTDDESAADALAERLNFDIEQWESKAQANRGRFP